MFVIVVASRIGTVVIRTVWTTFIGILTCTNVLWWHTCLGSLAGSETAMNWTCSLSAAVWCQQVTHVYLWSHTHECLLWLQFTCSCCVLCSFVVLWAVGITHILRGTFPSITCLWITGHWQISPPCQMVWFFFIRLSILGRKILRV